jgi:4-hydroxyacetophenone monooxygenase
VVVRTPAGEHTITAQAVISAVGQLSRPKMPEIEGLEDFAGPAFHSARWDHDVDLAGKRVCVIGTGASAAQFITEIGKEVGHMTVFQRTPNWLAPSPDYHEELNDQQNWLFTHIPVYSHWYRFYLYWRMAEGLLPAAKVDPEWDNGGLSVSLMNEFARLMLGQYIEEQFGRDPELLAKVLPQYPPIAKRVVRDNGVWAATLLQDNVDLVTERIARILPNGVETADGVVHEADVLIYGTGFHASEFLMPMKVTGRKGTDLHEQWGLDARAYMGITVPNFPNLFCLYGPNTNIVINGSIIFFSECEVDYILDALRFLLAEGRDSLDPTPAAHDAYNERIDRGNAEMAWGASDVNSWYKSASGRVAQNWPFSLLEYWEQTREIAPADYDVR